MAGFASVGVPQPLRLTPQVTAATTSRAVQCFRPAQRLSHRGLRRSQRCSPQSALPSDQQASTTGRQDEQHSISHADRYHRSQRKLPYKGILALALGGTALTAYLTASKLSGAPVVCGASGGCGSVLNSDYASIFGIPLSLLGLGAYSATAALAFKGVTAKSAKQPISDYGVLAGGAVLASCSASLL